MGMRYHRPMEVSLGERLSKEWQGDLFSVEVGNALELMVEDKVGGIETLNQLSEQGSRLAKVYLGSEYIDDDGLGGNYADLGEKLLQEASDMGSIEASFILAWHCMKSNNVARGFDLYERLASVDYSPAQFNLGFEYAVGRRVKKDPQKAIYHFEAAAKNGHLVARQWLCHILMKEKADVYSFMMGFLMKIFYVVPFVYTRIVFPNSDRLRR